MDVQIVTAMISAAVAATIGIMTWLNGRANLREQRISERRRSIVKKLNEFYGPLISYLNITKSLHTILIRGKPKGFRTLICLVEPEYEYDDGQNKVKARLTDSDRTIIGEIVEIEKKIESLIVEKGGLVDDRRLRSGYPSEVGFHEHQSISPPPASTSLATLITHFRVLRLAYDGKLVGDVERYESFVFPREIHRLLDEKYEELKSDLEKLSK